LALVNFIFGYSLPFTFAWFKFTCKGPLQII